MSSLESLKQQPCLSFGVIADVQYADTEDGYNFAKTNVRYYRTALQMLNKAVKIWNEDSLKRPKFMLQLGDIIDGKNKSLGIAESSLSTVLQAMSKFAGPVYHIWGNHEFYNFGREQLLSSDLYSGNTEGSIAEPGRAYYMVTPHPALRVLALDCYEISLLASLTGTKEFELASEIMKNHPNEDQNSSEGMVGTERRFVKYNGALSEEQLTWMEKNLEEAVQLRQNVVIIGM